MYLNTVILTGFLGNDAESHTSRPGTADAFSFVTLSLATKRTWKDRETGERQSVTCWHRCVVINPRIAAFAATLTKGAHVQLTGELQNREYTTKDGSLKSVTEIRVQRLARLDRAPQGAGDDTEVHEEDAA